jgi:hypothetical protein
MENLYIQGSGKLAALGALGAAGFIIWAAIAVLMIVSVWIIFNKAKQPGWAAIIPVYNILVMLKVAKKPWWWIIIFILPAFFATIHVLFVILYIIAIIFSIMAIHGISTNFGKGAGFTVGLVLLSVIFFPILAFDSSIKYVEEKSQVTDNVNVNEEPKPEIKEDTETK